MESSRRVLGREDCLQVARKYFGCDDVQVIGWQEKKLSEKPAGYLGDHMLAEVDASSNGRQVRISVFVKTMPTNENQASLIESCGAFRKEVLFYQQIARDWEERGFISADHESRGDDSEECSWYCRCYVARDDLIVLENLALFGYESSGSYDVLDLDHVVIALRMLASFHAASIALEEQRSIELKRRFQIGEEYPDLVKEAFYVFEDGHPGKEATEAGMVGIAECAKLLPVCDDPEVRRRVEELFPVVLRRMFSVVKTSNRFRNVICHADLWQNNILFREPVPGRRGTDVKLVDFQLLRYAPPAHDIFNLLHLTMRRDLRVTHEAELLDAYYAALDASLKRYGVDIRTALPRAEFVASLPEQRLAGRLSAAFILHFVLSSDDALGPVFRDPEVYERVVKEGNARAGLICSQFQKDPKYRERYEECLMELVENHVL